MRHTIPVPKVKKKNKGARYYQKKGCEEAKKQVRNERKCCEICGKTNCKLEAHHLLTVGAYPNMSNQKENLIVLCVHCHKFGKVSFHGSGTDIMKQKFDEKFPGRMEYLREKALQRKHVNYKEEYQSLIN